MAELLKCHWWKLAPHAAWLKNAPLKLHSCQLEHDCPLCHADWNKMTTCTSLESHTAWEPGLQTVLPWQQSVMVSILFFDCVWSYDSSTYRCLTIHVPNSQKRPSFWWSVCFLEYFKKEYSSESNLQCNLVLRIFILYFKVIFRSIIECRGQ